MSSAIAARPLRTLYFVNVIDIDILLVKKLKNKCCVFDNQRVNLAKNGKVLITKHSYEAWFQLCLGVYFLQI